MIAWVRRAAALAVALLCVLPLHRLLDPERNGAAGADAVARAEPVWGLTLWGSVLVVLVGIAVGVLSRGRLRDAPEQGGRPGDLGRLLAILERTIIAPAPWVFALGAGAVATVFASAVALGPHQRLLTGVDEMATLIHARYLAAGSWAGALPASPEGWLIPNMLVTGAGWVSQYPPGHILVWAAFVRVGLWWATGPLLLGAMVGLVAASFDRLLEPERRALGRVAALLLALSPFALALSARSPSHLTAGAAGALALYAGLRAANGRVVWALLAGAAVGSMVLARPWTGLVLGPTLTLGVWLEKGGISLAKRALAPWIVGGLPFGVLLFAVNDSLFGSPLTLGYSVLYGPSHGLGLHADPWSFPYGLREAVGYTASDLIQLGAILLDTPVSLALVGATYLVVVPRLPPGMRVIAAWALLPIFANAAYWFHAPRLLFEAVPAWLLLAAIAVRELHRHLDPAARVGVRWSVATTLLVALIAFGPLRLRSEVWSEETLSRITLPDSTAEGMLVFVHAGWDERTAAMLQASGMRNDSIQSILRRNDSCRLHEYALARLGGAASADLPAIDVTQTAERPPELVALRSLGGSVVWRGEGIEWSQACVRELSADRYGAIALAPLLWQGDLPGLERGEPMFVRDYGWERNDVVRAHFPGRQAAVWAYPPSGRPVLLEYEPAMATLWGSR